MNKEQAQPRFAWIDWDWEFVEAFKKSKLAGEKGGPATSAAPKAAVDIVETRVAHVFFLDVPGLKKDDVIVQIEEPPEKRIMSISGEGYRPMVEKPIEVHHAERPLVGPFTRRFRLPENVNLEAIRARVEDGLLTVLVPKRQQEEPTAGRKDRAAKEEDQQRFRSK